MLDFLFDPGIWASLVTLTILEIVLGIDNVIFIAITSSRLPRHRQPLARRLGLGLALVARIALLAGIAWVIGLTAPLFEIFEQQVSWRDIILGVGGLFLIAKGTVEIHNTVEGEEERRAAAAVAAGFAGVVTQIVLLDIVFSLDSVLTAVGMTTHVPVMVTAIVIAMGVMVFAAEPVSRFVERHPTVKMLALAFLLLIGMALVADGLHVHIPRGYLYFAVAFSVTVEALNLWTARRRKRRRLATGDKTA